MKFEVSHDAYMATVLGALQLGQSAAGISLRSVVKLGSFSGDGRSQMSMNGALAFVRAIVLPPPSCEGFKALSLLVARPMWNNSAVSVSPRSPFFCFFFGGLDGLGHSWQFSEIIPDRVWSTGIVNQLATCKENTLAVVLLQLISEGTKSYKEYYSLLGLFLTSLPDR